MTLPDVVAEPVSDRLQRREGANIGLLLRCVCASRREWNLDVVAGLLRRFLDRDATTQNDQVGQRNLLPTGLRIIEILLNRLQGGKDLRQFSRLVDFPILLRRQANAGPIGPAALVAAAERGRRRPGGLDQLRDG